MIIMGGMAVLTLLEVDASFAVPIIGLALFGFGMGIIMPTATDTIMAAVPVDEAGIGSSMNDTSREMGFALGVAILGLDSHQHLQKRRDPESRRHGIEPGSERCCG